MACAAALPKYSTILRETFHLINNYHISCTYKALFEDHANNVLCSLSDIEDASNVCPLDSAGQLANQRSDKPNETKYTCEDAGEAAVTPIKFRSSLLNQYEGVLANYGGCYKPNCQHLLTMFIKNALLKSKHDALALRDQVVSPWQTCSVSDAESCIHEHVNSKVSNGNVNCNSLVSPTVQSVQPFPTPNGARHPEPNKVKRTQLNSKGSDTKGKPSIEDPPSKIIKARCAPDYFKKENISYPFFHGDVYVGHIKSYRENVTKANLQEGMLRCSQQYQAMRIRSKVSWSSGRPIIKQNMYNIDFTKLNKQRLSTEKAKQCTLEPEVGNDLKIIRQNPLNGMEGHYNHTELSPGSDDPISPALNPSSSCRHRLRSQTPPETKGSASDTAHKSRTNVKKLPAPRKCRDPKLSTLTFRLSKGTSFSANENPKTK